MQLVVEYLTANIVQLPPHLNQGISLSDAVVEVLEFTVGWGAVKGAKYSVTLH